MGLPRIKFRHPNIVDYTFLKGTELIFSNRLGTVEADIYRLEEVLAQIRHMNKMKSANGTILLMPRSFTSPEVIADFIEAGFTVQFCDEESHAPEMVLRSSSGIQIVSMASTIDALLDHYGSRSTRSDIVVVSGSFSFHKTAIELIKHDRSDILLSYFSSHLDKRWMIHGYIPEYLKYHDLEDDDEYLFGKKLKESRYDKKLRRLVQECQEEYGNVPSIRE